MNEVPYGCSICALLTIPEQIGAQGDGATLIGLLEQLGRLLYAVVAQRLEVVLVEDVEYAQARADDDRDGAELVRRDVVGVQVDGLADELVGDVLAALVGHVAHGHGSLEEQAERQLGGQLGRHERVYRLKAELEYLAALHGPHLVAGRLVLVAVGELVGAEHNGRQREADALLARVAELLAGRLEYKKLLVRVLGAHQMNEACHERLLVHKVLVVLLVVGRHVVRVDDERTDYLQDAVDLLGRGEHGLVVERVVEQVLADELASDVVEVLVESGEVLDLQQVEHVLVQVDGYLEHLDELFGHLCVRLNTTSNQAHQ